jgi:FtsH-binding integral membrane protein
MSKKNSNMLPAKRSPLLTVCKVITLLLSLWFSGAMTALSGAGLIYNSESYGAELTNTGVFLIISTVLMVSGAVLCLFRKKLPNILAILFATGGLAICLVMLHKLTDHADTSGWTDKYTMLPISDMYTRRILPGIVPCALTAIIAAIQLFSQRRPTKKDEKAPSIV